MSRLQNQIGIDHQGQFLGIYIPRHLVEELGWTPGTRVNVEEVQGLVAVRAQRNGRFTAHNAHGVSTRGELKVNLPPEQAWFSTPGRWLAVVDQGILWAEPPAESTQRAAA